MKTRRPSRRRLHGVFVRAMHQAKAVASTSASKVRGTAIGKAGQQDLERGGVRQHGRQFSRVSAPGWPGAALQKVPKTTMPIG